jgi:hypothetical protein
MLVIDEGMNMEHWWNVTDRQSEVLGGKPVPVPLCPVYCNFAYCCRGETLVLVWFECVGGQGAWEIFVQRGWK